MPAPRPVVALVVLVALLLLSGWLLWSPEPESPAVEPAPPTTASQTGATEHSPAPRGGAAGPSEQALARAAVAHGGTAHPASAGDVAVVRGHCVDERGAPLPGVPVDVGGLGRNEEDLAQYRLDHGTVVWSDPRPVESDAEGRFEIAFTPPPPYQFHCAITPADRVRVTFWWAQLAAGDVKDVGDVVLAPGAILRGMLTDEAGGALTDVYLTLQAQRDPDDRATFDAQGEHRRTVAHRFFVRTGPRGAFEIDQRVPLGTYRIDARDHVVVAPDLPVEVTAPATDLRIVARALAAGPAASIEGRVVDERGLPVPGVRLEARATGSGVGSAVSDDDGGFMIARRDDGGSEPAATLTTERKGYAHWTSDAPIPWGTKDLLIRLVAGPALTLRVTRGDTGAPVERFGIVLAPQREGGAYSSTDDRILHLGDHPGGVLEIPRITPQRYRLEVRPPGGTGVAASPPQIVEFEGTAPIELEIALPARVTRRIELAFADGSPVAGARVEFLRNLGGLPVTMHTWAMDAANAARNSPEHVAELVSEGETDARGGLELEAASGLDYALRLPGPGHVPLVVQPVRIEGEGPLRVVVDAGARLLGRVEPLGILQQLRDEALGNPDARPPAIRLLGRDERRGESFPGGSYGDSNLALDEQGRFVAEGVPPGTWAVAVTWQQTRLNWEGAHSGMSSPTRVALDGLELTEGTTREVVVDLTSWERRPVEFAVRRNGQPVRARLTVQGVLASESGSEPVRSGYIVLTDDEGRASQPLPAGMWTAEPLLRIAGRWVGAAGVEFTVVAGRPTPPVDLDLQIAERRIRVLRPDGEPAAGISLGARAAGDRTATCMDTDASGRTVVFGTSGPHTLRTLRQPFRDPEALRTWREEHPGADDSLLSVDLEPIELLIGPADELVLRLPDEWASLPK